MAFILSFALGANDVANGMQQQSSFLLISLPLALGTSVGSGAVSLRHACIIAAVFEFSGAASLGHLVSGTLKTGIVSPNDFRKANIPLKIIHIPPANPELFVLGMLCTLTVSAAWLMIATFLALPVSTTQTIVGGIFGFAVAEVGYIKNHLTDL